MESIEKLNKLNKKVNEIEKKYNLAKCEYYNTRNTELINTNWEELNLIRKDKGLTPLSSDTKKTAYIETKLYNAKVEYKNLEAEYNYLKRAYETALLEVKIMSQL